MQHAKCLPDVQRDPGLACDLVPSHIGDRERVTLPQPGNARDPQIHSGARGDWESAANALQ